MSKVALSPVETRPRVVAKEGTYKVAATTLVLGTNARVQLKNITHEIAEVVAQTSIRDGIVQISSLHTTAGLMLNEVQDALLDDVTAMFEQFVPRGGYYKHNDPEHSDCDRQNADSHLRAVVIGHSLSIPVENGRLKLGTWQQVLFTEFDGPNTRRLHVQVMGI